MPIVAKHIAEERRRRRALAAQASSVAQSPEVIAADDALPAPSSDPSATDAPIDVTGAEPAPKKGRGHPPLEHRFKKGNKGGPGRPKGSKNHDTKLKERFETKRAIKINGVEQVVSQHDILIDLRFKQAMEGKDRAHQALLDEAARLYPANDERERGTGLPKALTRGEQALLEQLLGEINLPPMVLAALPQIVAGSDCAEEADEEKIADEEEGA